MTRQYFGSSNHKFNDFAIECVFGDRPCAATWVHGNITLENHGHLWELVQ